ncbi:MAG: hypothetical protein FJ161_01655 [Gammaproteobacteria bacterium]|nr:hypothetical protein [Gammaproteobacteria bacterium]
MFDISTYLNPIRESLSNFFEELKNDPRSKIKSIYNSVLEADWFELADSLYQSYNNAEKFLFETFPYTVVPNYIAKIKSFLPADIFDIKDTPKGQPKTDSQDKRAVADIVKNFCNNESNLKLIHLFSEINRLKTQIKEKPGNTPEKSTLQTKKSELNQQQDSLNQYKSCINEIAEEYANELSCAYRDFAIDKHRLSEEYTDNINKFFDIQKNLTAWNNLEQKISILCRNSNIDDSSRNSILTAFKNATSESITLPPTAQPIEKELAILLKEYPIQQLQQGLKFDTLDAISFESFERAQNESLKKYQDKIKELNGKYTDCLASIGAELNDIRPIQLKITEWWQKNIDIIFDVIRPFYKKAMIGYCYAWGLKDVIKKIEEKEFQNIDTDKYEQFKKAMVDRKNTTTNTNQAPGEETPDHTQEIDLTDPIMLKKYHFEIAEISNIYQTELSLCLQDTIARLKDRRDAIKTHFDVVLDIKNIRLARKNAESALNTYCKNNLIENDIRLELLQRLNTHNVTNCNTELSCPTAQTMEDNKKHALLNTFVGIFIKYPELDRNDIDIIYATESQRMSATAKSFNTQLTNQRNEYNNIEKKYCNIAKGYGLNTSELSSIGFKINSFWKIKMIELSSRILTYFYMGLELYCYAFGLKDLVTTDKKSPSKEEHQTEEYLEFLKKYDSLKTNREAVIEKKNQRIEDISAIRLKLQELYANYINISRDITQDDIRNETNSLLNELHNSLRDAYLKISYMDYLFFIALTSIQNFFTTISNILNTPKTGKPEESETQLTLTDLKNTVNSLNTELTKSNESVETAAQALENTRIAIQSSPYKLKRKSDLTNLSKDYVYELTLIYNKYLTEKKIISKKYTSNFNILSEASKTLRNEKSGLITKKEADTRRDILNENFICFESLSKNDVELTDSYHQDIKKLRETYTPKTLELKAELKDIEPMHAKIVLWWQHILNSSSSSIVHSYRSCLMTYYCLRGLKEWVIHKEGTNDKKMPDAAVTIQYTGETAKTLDINQSPIIFQASADNHPIIRPRAHSCPG